MRIVPTSFNQQSLNFKSSANNTNITETLKNGNKSLYITGAVTTVGYIGCTILDKTITKKIKTFKNTDPKLAKYVIMSGITQTSKKIFGLMIIPLAIFELLDFHKKMSSCEEKYPILKKTPSQLLFHKNNN